MDIEKIEKIIGMTGEFNEKENVLKISYPRKDLEVKANGVILTPAMGLTAWAAFTKEKNHLMVMGDIVLTEGQVNTVMSAALDNGLEVTGLHNHFFVENPKIMFMHIGGMGDEEKLANGVAHVFSTLKSSSEEAFPSISIDPKNSTLDPKLIEEILGHKGELKDGVYKVTIGRTTKMNGMAAGNAMGVNTWAAFAGSDQTAIVDGDFAMLESELQSVLKTLRKAKINILAIHNHMTNENPRILFLHFWGIGKTTDLAKGLSGALKTQKQ
jgi:hypothetical protein